HRLLPSTLITSFIQRARDHLDLHSFPTRRSSDLTADRPRLHEGLVDGLRRRKGVLEHYVDLPRRCRLHDAERRNVPRRLCGGERSEEHTSELQSRENLVCRLLLEKKNKQKIYTTT